MAEPLPLPRRDGGAPPDIAMPKAGPSPAGPSRLGSGAVARWAYPGLALIALVIAWQLVVSLGGLHNFVLPAPLAVATRLVATADLLAAATPATVLAILLGFAAAAALGVPLAVLMCASRPFEQSVYPLLVGSQGIPKVALAPVFIVWFGFGLVPKVVMAMLIAFFPIVINTVVGLRSIDPTYLQLARSMGATRTRIYRRLLLPNALPHIFAGLKVAMALAIVGAIVGEMVGANTGLGYLLVVANGNMDMALVFAVLAWLVVVSLVLVGLVDLGERLAIPWSRNARLRHIAQGGG